jgi:hypothetical protein
MGIQKIAKINSGSVRKRCRVRVDLNTFSRYVIPEDSYRGSTEKEYGFPIKALGNDSKWSILVLES